MQEVYRYSYLWNGTQLGWTLMRVNRQSMSLCIIFSEQGPTVAELKAVREVVPSYKGLTSSEVLRALRGTSKLNVDFPDSQTGRRIALICRQHGLVIEEYAQDQSGFLLFNELTKMALVIEDEVVGEAVKDEALRRGVPVRHIEA
ncbi:hypothetical protein [Xanthomonas sacchari]|uniref:hypothetical protein n=1 Tax=Xanthomonas sacchari TaxID=56458 RepID=UPI0011107A60|nr:hypothetical protein [Xanthomonas sacchari]MDV0438652.1 hypothetical protein [Xanthomonas sacchari]